MFLIYAINIFTTTIYEKYLEECLALDKHYATRLLVSLSTSHLIIENNVVFCFIYYCIPCSWILNAWYIAGPQVIYLEWLIYM